MSDFRIDKITNRDGSAGTQIAGISTFSGTSGMVMPGGSFEYRGGRGRGVFGSGSTPSGTNVLDTIEIATTGDATDFGDDSIIRTEGNASFSSSTKGFYAGGWVSPVVSSTISYFIFSSGGGVNNFGDLHKPMYSQGGCGNQIRGISGGGRDESGISYGNVIQFVTISSTGDASDFGDLSENRSYTASGIASPTRGIWHGGGNAPSSVSRVIDYVTIATTGNATKFGSLITGRNAHTGCSNSTRGLIISGQTPTNLNSM